MNTGALTGESMPRSVRSGDNIISGCINMTGVLKVRTTKEFGESTVSKILDLVENARLQKIKIRKFHFEVRQNIHPDCLLFCARFSGTAADPASCFRTPFRVE